MAIDICTASSSPSGCSHFNLTVTVDGSPVSLHLNDADLLTPLSDAEKEQFVRLAARRLRQSGVTLSQFLNRVLHGEEATNVKQYDIIGPGGAVTKTNIGSSYVDVLPGVNGQRVLVDFTGCTQFRIILNANLVGTGPFRARIVRDSDNAVLYENTNLGAAGERELDTDWQSLPAQATGLTLVRLQANSVTAADDPVFRRCVMVVR